MTSSSSPTKSKKESRKARNLRIAASIAQMLAMSMPLFIKMFSSNEQSFDVDDEMAVHDIVAEKAWSKLPAP
jgi:hypothetical protein